MRESGLTYYRRRRIKTQCSSAAVVVVVVLIVVCVRVLWSIRNDGDRTQLQYARVRAMRAMPICATIDKATTYLRARRGVACDRATISGTFWCAFGDVRRTWKPHQRVAAREQ